MPLGGTPPSAPAPHRVAPGKMPLGGTPFSARPAPCCPGQDAPGRNPPFSARPAPCCPGQDAPGRNPPFSARPAPCCPGCVYGAQLTICIVCDTGGTGPANHHSPKVLERNLTTKKIYSGSHCFDHTYPELVLKATPQAVKVDADGPPCFWCSGPSCEDALTRYSCAYPAFTEMVRFNRMYDEAKVLSFQPGQEDKALVGIRKYKWDSLQDLGADRIKYVRSLRTQTPRYPGSAMAALIDYIQRRDQEGVAAVVRPAAASNTRPKSAAT
ncbi:uncharacterized protein LOC135559797 [Oncorhynchus nerka]|uniref:uncharacterized protein LOC135559797 n=1 Tax=Oncorhynchus nerka TaxID=8023 RepID=UPI0031B8AD93